MLRTQLLEGDVPFLRQVQRNICLRTRCCIATQLLVLTIEFLSSLYLRDVEAFAIVTVRDYGILVAEYPSVARHDFRVPCRFVSGLPGLISNPEDPGRVAFRILQGFFGSSTAIRR